MKSNRLAQFFMVMSLIPVVAMGAGPGKRSVPIGTASVAQVIEKDGKQASYYTMTYLLPADLKAESLDRVILELVMDVEAQEQDGYVGEAPVLYVRSLESSAIRGSDGEENAVFATRPVAVGANRHVKVDVTEIIRAQLARPGAHGLAIGALRGMQEGEFKIHRGGMSQGNTGELNIYATGDR